MSLVKLKNTFSQASVLELVLRIGWGRLHLRFDGITKRLYEFFQVGFFPKNARDFTQTALTKHIPRRLVLARAKEYI